jgi:hypothetical protein
MISRLVVICGSALVLAGGPALAVPQVMVPKPAIPSGEYDGRARELLREVSASFLEGSPGRDLPMGTSYWDFRSTVWVKIEEKCYAFERDHPGKLPTPELLAIVGDTTESPRAREMAAWVLAARLLRKEDEGRSTAALRLPPLSSDGTPGLGRSLAGLLESSDRITRFSAVAVIGAHGAADSADALVLAIKGPYLPERVAACRAIGRFGVEGLGTEGIGLLRPLIYDHPDISVTQAAARALLLAGTVEYEKRGTTTAIDELIRALRYAPHPGEPLDRKDFGSWGDGKTEHVIGFTEEEIASGARSDAFIRYAAALSLGQLDIDELQYRAFEPMLKALGDENIGVEDAAFRFVMHVGVRGLEWGAGPIVESLLKAPDETLATEGAILLWNWGEWMRPYLPLLIDQTGARLDRHADVFFHVWALGNSGDPRAEAYLQRLRGKIGPQTRPLDDEGKEFNNDKQLLKLIDDGLARIQQIKDLKSSPDAGVQDKALAEALKQSRRRYLAPTLLAMIKDGKQGEEMRVRCATALREIEPVASPAWFAEIVASGIDLPARLKAVLEQERPSRTEEGE